MISLSSELFDIHSGKEKSQRIYIEYAPRTGSAQGNKAQIGLIGKEFIVSSQAEVSARPNRSDWIMSSMDG